MEGSLCPNCENGVFCSIWTEWKCVVQKRRVYEYAEMTSCNDYKKRGKDFKERKCQCEDCLKSDLVETEYA